MSRYQALRSIGCDPVAAGWVAFLNWLFGVPSGLVKFMTFEMEYEE